MPTTTSRSDMDTNCIVIVDNEWYEMTRSIDSNSVVMAWPTSSLGWASIDGVTIYERTTGSNEIAQVFDYLNERNHHNEAAWVILGGLLLVAFALAVWESRRGGVDD